MQLVYFIVMHLCIAGFATASITHRISFQTFTQLCFYKEKKSIKLTKKKTNMKLKVKSSYKFSVHANLQICPPIVTINNLSV
jgi:hypothetical protein